VSVSVARAEDPSSKALALYETLAKYHPPAISRPVKPDSVAYQLFIIPVRRPESATIITAVIRLSDGNGANSGTIQMQMHQDGNKKQIEQIQLDARASGEFLRDIGRSEVLSLPEKPTPAPYEDSYVFDGTVYILFRFDSGGTRGTLRLGTKSEPMMDAVEAFRQHVKSFSQKDDEKDKSKEKEK
jgi:hypothetical protein